MVEIMFENGELLQVEMDETEYEKLDLAFQEVDFYIADNLTLNCESVVYIRRINEY